MTRLTRLCRAVGVGLAVAAATLSMTQVAHAAPKAPPAAPTSLAPPPGNEQFLVAPAKGVQIYKCSENPDTKAIVWTFVKPQATLTTDNGQVIDHFGGPTWKAADGSTVTGSAPIKVPADTDPNFNPATAKDIQQLLLKATPVVPAVPGILDATTFIQRLNTKGGTQPPAASCKAQTLNKVQEVPYQADYVFFKATA